MISGHVQGAYITLVSNLSNIIEFVVLVFIDLKKSFLSHEEEHLLLGEAGHFS